MTARDIQYYLEKNYFRNGCKFIIPNIYYFGYGDNHETDLLIVKNNGSVFDIEVKISRSDYWADFKKVSKHQVLETGTYTCDYRKHSRNSDGKNQWYEPGEPIPCSIRPNRFYFAVPQGMIKPEELPAYAGLFYIMPDGSVEKVREGKQLHKGKITNFEKIASKCYWMWRTQKPINVVTATHNDL